MGRLRRPARGFRQPQPRFGAITDTLSFARTAEVGGPIQITSVKSAGKIKTDKKTFSKYQGNLLIRYTGVSPPARTRARK